MHLRQDIAFDKFIREQIDCSKRYEDDFVWNSKHYNGKDVRALIGQIEQQGIYYLAHELYETKGITANQEWFDTTVKPALEEAYPPELAEKTYSYMKIDPEYNRYITEHDWSHLDEGPVSQEEYKECYDGILESMEAPTRYFAVQDDPSL